MLPVLAAPDQVDIRWMYAKQAGDGGRAQNALRVESSDLAHLLGGQLVSRRVFAAECPLAIPSLPAHVGVVVSLSTEPQVSRTHAPSVIAMVENGQSGWDRAVRESPGHPVRSVYAPEVETDHSIPSAFRWAVHSQQSPDLSTFAQNRSSRGMWRMTHSSIQAISQCVVCGRKARLVTLPLIGRRAWLCRVCGPAQMIATMRGLIAHG